MIYRSLSQQKMSLLVCHNAQFSTVRVLAQLQETLKTNQLGYSKSLRIRIFWNYCVKADVHGLILTSVLPLISQLHPQSDPSSQIPPLPPPISHPTQPCCHPTASILCNSPTIFSSTPRPTLPADGEHDLTSDDGSTLSQSVSLTQSPQSTPAKEGITHSQRGDTVSEWSSLPSFGFECTRIQIKQDQSSECI